MSGQGFCTSCGAPRPADAKFCTSCGAAASGANPPPQASGAPTPATAIALGTLLLVLGSTAAYFSMRTSAEVERAVSGTPGGPSPAAQGDDSGLPSGHPDIGLPQEVVDFLAGLAAEAEKNPQSVEAAQKLARARYRASVINVAYQAPAEQALARLLELDPDNAEGLRISANLAYDAGQFAEAQRRFQAFLAKHPDDVSAITDLGSTLLFQDQFDEAIGTYRSAIAKNANFMQAHFNLGIALQRKGDKDEAIASLRRAVELTETPDEKQHVENALAELEEREPLQIAGARIGKKPAASGAGAAQGMQGGAPVADAQGTTAGAGRAAGMMAKPDAAAAPPAGAAGDAPAASAADGMQGGMAMPPSAPDREVPTNASSDFQRQAEKPVVTHPIVGPRVVSFEWTGPTSLRAKIADFPMDRMPPFAREKFKSAMGDKIHTVAAANGVTGPVKVEIVDSASGLVMETLDATAAAAPPPAGAAK